MVKRLTLLGAFSILALSAGSVRAGDYHSGSTLICADCHTMHYSVSHQYDGNAPRSLGTGGPFVGLLKRSPNDLCIACHDGRSFAPDVVGANTGTHVRQAGALTTGVTPYEDWKGHTLGKPGVVAPGGTFTTGEHGLECLTCHAQHGQASGVNWGEGVTGYTNGNWRNLRTTANGGTGVALGYAKGTNDTRLPIFERDGSLGQVATHYSVDNVDFNEPDAAKSAYAEWCQKCHTNFHGAENTGSAMNWSRHPTAGINIGTPGASHYSDLAQFKSRGNRVKVMNPAGIWDTTQTDYTPSCFSCHKAHGNQNAFGLIYMKGTGVVTEQGDEGTMQKNLCRQCHKQGTDT